MSDKKSAGWETVLHLRGTTLCSGVHNPQFVIAEIIEAPRLRGITTPDFVEFKNKRDIYERRLAGIDPDPQVLVHLATYRDSIPRYLLNVLVHTDMVEATRIEDITEEDLRNYIARIASIGVNTHRSTELKHLRFRTKCPGTFDSLTESIKALCGEYFSTLEKWGSENLIEVAPDAAISHIMDRIRDDVRISHNHETQVYQMIKTRKADGTKKPFWWFFKTLLEEAHRIDVDEQTTPCPYNRSFYRRDS